MSRDGWTMLSAYLTADEAEMLRGVLESEGIDCAVEDGTLASLNPLLQSAIGGAKVLVPAAQAEAARELAAASGVLPGAAAGEPVHIPEHEWRAGATEGAGAEILALPRDERDPDLRSRRALRAALVAVPLSFTVVAPLWAASTAARVLGAVRAAPRAVRLRAAAAAVVALLSLGLAGAFWTKVVPDVGRAAQAERERPGVPPARPHRAFP